MCGADITPMATGTARWQAAVISFPPASRGINARTRVHRLLHCVRGFTWPQPLGMAAPRASAKIALLLRWPLVARTFPRDEEEGREGRKGETTSSPASLTSGQRRLPTWPPAEAGPVTAPACRYRRCILNERQIAASG